MIRDHAEIEELLAIRSLGGLDGDDVQLLESELASHGDCEECRRLEREYDETAGRLAFALDPAPVDMGQADEILRRATHPATQEVAPATVTGPIDELEARRARRGRSWPALVAAAVAIILAVSAVVIIGRERSTGVQASTDQQVVGFTGDAGELAMAYRPGESGALLRGIGVRRSGCGQGLCDLDAAGNDARQRWMRAPARRHHRRVRERRSDRHRSDGGDRGTRVLPVRTHHHAGPGQRSAGRLAGRRGYRPLNRVLPGRWRASPYLGTWSWFTRNREDRRTR